MIMAPYGKILLNVKRLLHFSLEFLITVIVGNLLLAHISEQYLVGATVVMVVDDAVVVLTVVMVVVIGGMVVEDVLDSCGAKFSSFLSLLCMRKLLPEENPLCSYLCQ